MATPKKPGAKMGRPKKMEADRMVYCTMNIRFADCDIKNIYRIANAHGLSKADAVRLAILELCAKMDREESKPLLPAVGS